MRSAAGVVTVALALTLAGDVRADLVTLDFTGTFTGTDGDASLAAGTGLAGLIGKNFTGSARYDPAGPVTASEYRTPEISITNYAFGPSADAAFALSLGGAIVVSAPALAPFDVAVFRGSHPGVLVRAGIPAGPYYLVLSLDDAAGKVVKDASLPAALDLTRFGGVLFGVGWQQGDAWVEVEGAAAPLAAAPEPASVVLAGLSAVLACGFAGWRRRFAG